MRIGFDAKRLFHNNSGLGNYSRDLVRILSNFFPENDYYLFAKNKSNKGNELLNMKNISFNRIDKGIFSRQIKMGFNAQSEDCDIFHGLSGELPIKWEKNKKIKKVVSIHDLIFLKYPQFYSFFDRKIHCWKVQNAIKEADLVIAISEQTKKDIIEYFHASEEKIHVVYQTCSDNFKKIYSKQHLFATSEKFKLPERFILNVGTIEERKNLFSIVKAIKGLKIPLVVVGKETNYSKLIKRFISENNMQRQVYFLQKVENIELSHIYQLADIFVYPSLYEGFGIPIIEAMFSKIPVITSNSSCLPEAGGTNSMYVNPTNIYDIRSKIVHLWENSEERARRAEKSLEFVKKFNEDKIAEELIKLYKEVLSK